MARVVSVNMDAARIEGVLSKSTRRVSCREVTEVGAILLRPGAPPPDLIVLGGGTAAAADVAEALLDHAVLCAAPVVAWGIRGTLGETARLVASGVRVVVGDEDALRTACEEALDAREGRTIRVDALTEHPTGSAVAPDLHGRRVIVADDDPAIRWFFVDILRAQGCDVEDVGDGEAALDRARRTVPDLVVSDIRMPRMDGVNLCRALRSDVILADVPLVLLSWKEDWLLRAEGGGANASAYLAKRSTPEEVLIRVHEVLEPHARLERRLQTPGAVRGRLDGTAPYRLLRLACATHPDSRLTVRCAQNGYEVHIRDGVPRSVAKLTVEGAALAGLPALACLLEERVGRFTLTPEMGPVEADLRGSLHQQIAAHVARSRHGVESPPNRGAPEPPQNITKVSALPSPTLVAAAPSPPVRLGASERPPESPSPTLRIAPRLLLPVRPAAAPVIVAPAPRFPEQTLPLARPAPRRRPPVTSRPPTELGGARSWGIPLRWIGVAAIAALGIVLGAGVRALRQPPADSPTPSTPVVPSH